MAMVDRVQSVSKSSSRLQGVCDEIRSPTLDRARHFTIVSTLRKWLDRSMVVFHVQCGDRSVFLFEASVSTSTDSLIRSLCRVQNLRLRLTDVLEGWGLAWQTRANDNEHERFNEVDGVDEQLRRVARDVKMVLDSKTQVARRICLKERELLEKLQQIRDIVTIAFPRGDLKALADSSAVLDIMLEDTAELWWAGKQVVRGRDVRDLVGGNEKSTLVVTLQKKGDGAPSNERIAMTAFDSKKQEELQQAAEEKVEDYTIPFWADPKALKKSLRGTGSSRPF